MARLAFLKKVYLYMLQDLLKENNAPVSEVKIGDKTIGAEAYFPFLNYDGKVSTKPLVAIEVFDANYDAAGADALFLRISNAAQNNVDMKKIADSEKLPLIIWAAGQKENELILFKAAEALKGYNILAGPVNQNNIKDMAKSSLENNHGLIIETPLDINIAKQIALSLNNLGVAFSKMVIYPTSGSIGYGFEYAYSVSERIRLAGFSGDKYLALPIMSMPAEVVWNLRETNEENPLWGDLKKRGYIWEAVTAFSYIIAGADIVVVRHSNSVKALKRSLTCS